MKTILQECLFIGMVVILLLSSCTAALPTIPTSTVTPAPTPTSTPPPPYKMLSPEDMRSDLDELFHQIEKYHPDPYMHRSKDDVDRDRQVLYEELDQPMTIVDYYRKVAPLIDSLGDSHTIVFLSSRYIPSRLIAMRSFCRLDWNLRVGKAIILSQLHRQPGNSPGSRVTVD